MQNSQKSNTTESPSFYDDQSSEIKQQDVADIPIHSDNVKGKNKVIEVDDEESKQSRSNNLKSEDKPLVSHESSIETYKSYSSCVD